MNSKRLTTLFYSSSGSEPIALGSLRLRLFPSLSFTLCPPPLPTSLVFLCVPHKQGASSRFEVSVTDDSPSLSVSPADGKFSLSALQASTDLPFSLQGAAPATAQINCKVRDGLVDVAWAVQVLWGSAVAVMISMG